MIETESYFSRLLPGYIHDLSGSTHLHTDSDRLQKTERYVRFSRFTAIHLFSLMR
jgi:hypothetical protein